MTAHRYGKIIGRYVIYRGESTETNGIEYLNVKEYLSGLKNNNPCIDKWGDSL